MEHPLAGAEPEEFEGGVDPAAERTDAELTAAAVLDPDVALTLLGAGTITIEGQVLDASNTTLYVRVEAHGQCAAAAYKPVAGERPLWDFPDGTLAEREVAAFVVAREVGGDLIPPTALREGPYGLGMLQLWIEVDPAVDIRRLLRAGGPNLRRIALLDAVINNGDRKGGHLLATSSGHVYGIDHGVTFNVDDKLRTVLWNWAGESLEPEEIRTLERLRESFDDRLADELLELLTRAEVRRTRHRVERLLRTRTLPMPSRDWPPVPWPAM